MLLISMIRVSFLIGLTFEEIGHGQPAMNDGFQTQKHHKKQVSESILPTHIQFILNLVSIAGWPLGGS